MAVPAEVWGEITLLGDIRLWIIVIFLLAAYIFLSSNGRQRRKTWKGLLAALVISLVVASSASFFLKTAFGVPRDCTSCEGAGEPAGCNPYCPRDPNSFPSGHSAISFAMIGAVWISTGRKIRNAWIFVLPALVAASRILLDVHTPADVLAGSAVGVFSFAAAYLILRHTKGVFRR